jgi:hypothetical protein
VKTFCAPNGQRAAAGSRLNGMGQSKLSKWHMKSVQILFLGLACVALATAQTAVDGPTPAGVTPLKLSWEHRVQLPGWDQSPFSAANNSVYDASSSSAPRPGQSPLGSLTRFGERRQFFEYALKLRNDGEKPIRGVTWEYQFLDPGSKEVLGHHRFFSYRKVGSHKTATLVGRSPSAPTKIVTVTGLEKDKQAPFDERVQIKCVLYKDGSVWKHPAATDSDCERLKHRPRRGR